MLAPAIPAGEVVASEPAAGSTVAIGTGVEITIAAGSDAATTPQPTTAPSANP